MKNDIVLSNLDIFPTINMIYNLTEKQNLRISASKTIARPSFKELSYAEIYDPISGNTFIGGLFRDANDIAGIEYWDGNLTSSDIYNFDLRWELFPASGQVISLSGFFKKFNNPIEMVQFATQTGSFQPRNVGDGQVLGAEFELRQNLAFISPALKSLSFTANFTYTESQIELSKTELDSRIENLRTGETVEKYRVMAGQAPYLINGGISYKGNKEGFWSNFEAGVFYNVQGKTLQYVGIADRPNIYSLPFHSLNFNTNFNINQKLKVGFKVENILNSKQESVFSSFNAIDQYYSRLYSGRTFSFKISYDLF
jgi:outer membrane receptor protein involved in Fe transport